MGLDLADLWLGRMSFRRLGVILKHLPGDSAYATAVRESITETEWAAIERAPAAEKHGRWSRSDFLLARVGDLVNHLIWMHTDRKTEPPQPLPRPGVKAVDIAANLVAIEYLQRVDELRGAQPDG